MAEDGKVCTERPLEVELESPSNVKSQIKWPIIHIYFLYSVHVTKCAIWPLFHQSSNVQYVIVPYHCNARIVGVIIIQYDN